jgi:hypothetical protein
MMMMVKLPSDPALAALGFSSITNDKGLREATLSLYGQNR